MNSVKIDSLWKWFVANEEQIIVAIKQEYASDHLVESLDNLVLDLGMFTWEIGPGSIKPWFFTISPNGDRELIKVSKKIMEHAPYLANWELNHSKPAKDWDRRFVIYDNNMNEQHVDASDWKYVVLPARDGMIELLLEAENIRHLDRDTAITAANRFITDEIGEETKIDRILSVDIVDQLEPQYQLQKTEIRSIKKHFE